MLALIAIALTFIFFAATLHKAMQGMVRESQIYAGWAFISFGACLALDGSDGWATGLILLGVGVMWWHGRGN